MEQRDTLEIHLATIHDPIANTKCVRALNELLYTASETGVIDGIDAAAAITVWKLVVLAQTLGEDIPAGLRM